MSGRGWELPVGATMTVVLVVVVMPSPFRVVSTEAVFILTFGAAEE